MESKDIERQHNIELVWFNRQPVLIVNNEKIGLTHDQLLKLAWRAVDMIFDQYNLVPR